MKYQELKDPKNPKIIHTIFPGPNGWEHNMSISAEECEKETLKILKKWRKITWFDRLYYKLTGKVR